MVTLSVSLVCLPFWFQTYFVPVPRLNSCVRSNSKYGHKSVTDKQTHTFLDDFALTRQGGQLCHDHKVSQRECARRLALLDNNHKTAFGENMGSACEEFFKCRHCSRIIRREERDPSQHRCGEMKCSTCKEYVDPQEHRCYIQPVEMEPPNQNPPTRKRKKGDEPVKDDRPRFIFYDLETLRQVDISAENDKHILNTNLAVVQKVCDDCRHISTITTETRCKRCGIKEHVFSGPDTIKSFCEWLFTPENEGSIVIAHNLKGFDSYPILKHCYDNAILPTLILSGSKVMSIVSRGENAGTSSSKGNR